MVDQAVRHIDRPRLRAFRDHFSGEVVLPDDETYDASRAVWNGMIDRRPALIVRPTRHRRGRRRAPLRPGRGPGHRRPERRPQHARALDLRRRRVIDLAGMRGVTVDPDRRVARCNGGALLGELDDAAQAVGLACTAGTVSHTGIAGLTLGGGMGRLQRKLGLAIDCLRAVELVTADGAWSAPARTRTRTCSGACAGPAPTSGSSRRSNSIWRRSGPRSRVASSSTRPSAPGTCSPRFASSGRPHPTTSCRR